MNSTQNAQNTQSITQKELRALRKKMHEAQGEKCPILRCKFPVEIMVVDHLHRRAGQKLGENGAGCIRGVIHRQANVLEGKFINAFYRYGLHKFIDPVTFLRNLADYLEAKTTNIIHPAEAQKERKKTIQRLKKSSFGKLKKALEEAGYKGKMPEYPKLGRMTAFILKLFERVNLQPEYYKEQT